MTTNLREKLPENTAGSSDGMDGRALAEKTTGAKDAQLNSSGRGIGRIAIRWLAIAFSAAFWFGILLLVWAIL